MRARLIVLLLATLAAGSMAAGNGRSRALNAHEILVAQTATEMLARGDYLVPYYNGQVRLEKPPLAYWLAAVSHRLVGSPSATRVSELEARIPSLVCGLLLLLVTFELGRIAFDDSRVGLVAAAILATSWHFFTLSRSARPEMLYALFCTLAMLGFMVSIRRAEREQGTFAPALLGWASVALALLAKGPQLQLFFLVGIALALWRRAPRVSFAAALHPGLGALVVALVLPYFVYLAMQADQAASFWAGQMVQDEPIPLWLRPLRFYYVYAVLLGLCPWIAPLGLPLLRERVRTHRSTRVLTACVIVAVVCLSFAGKLRHHYVLPTIPLFAVLIAAALVDLHRAAAAGEAPSNGVRRIAIAHATLTGIAFIALAVLATQPSPVDGERMWPAALPWLAAATLLVWIAARSASARPAQAFRVHVAALFVAWTAVSVAGLDASPRWESEAEFANAVDARVPAGEPLFLESGTEEPLVYYGHRRVVWGRAREWLDAHPSEPIPYFVCEGRCVDADGDVVSAERERRGAETLILLRPERRAPAPASDSESASTGPAPAPR